MALARAGEGPGLAAACRPRGHRLGHRLPQGAVRGPVHRPVRGSRPPLPCFQPLRAGRPRFCRGGPPARRGGRAGASPPGFGHAAAQGRRQPGRSLGLGAGASRPAGLRRDRSNRQQRQNHGQDPAGRRPRGLRNPGQPEQPPGCAPVSGLHTQGSSRGPVRDRHQSSRRNRALVGTGSSPAGAGVECASGPCGVFRGPRRAAEGKVEHLQRVDFGRAVDC